MDANKLRVLEDIQYKARKVCGNCEFFKRGGSGKQRGVFGVCRIRHYQHLKHTESNRGLSVYEAGYCREHKWNTKVVGIMHGFGQLREDT